MGLGETEQAQLGEVAVAPSLVVGAPRPTPPSRAFAQDGAEPAASISIHRRERRAMTVPEVAIPAAQHLIEPRDGVLGSDQTADPSTRMSMSTKSRQSQTEACNDHTEIPKTLLALSPPGPKAICSRWYRSSRKRIRRRRRRQDFPSSLVGPPISSVVRRPAQKVARSGRRITRSDNPAAVGCTRGPR